MKSLFFLVTLIIGLLLFSCVSPTNQNGSLATSNESKPQTALDAEALAEYTKRFDNIFTKCGDSYYTKYKETYRSKPGATDPSDYKIVKIIKLKDVSFDVNASTLNAADKLNELEWKGYANSTYVAFQTYIENVAGGSKWDEWKPKGISGSPGLALTGEKKKSVWTFEDFNSENNNSSYYRLVVYMKISCSEIPQ